MEAKLAAYRSKKRREAMIEGAKTSFKGALSWTERMVDVTPAAEVIFRESHGDLSVNSLLFDFSIVL